MAADMAVELKKQNVACVSLWPGAVMTEHVNDFLSQPQDEIVIFLYLYFLPYLYFYSRHICSLEFLKLTSSLNFY